MMKFNDYVRAVRGYLRNYKQFKVMLQNFQSEKALLLAELQGQSISVASYGPSVHGFSELNSLEKNALERIELTDKLAVIEENITNLEDLILRLERAFNILPDDDFKILQGFYIDHKSWRRVADEQFISEQWARKKGHKIVRQIAEILYVPSLILPDSLPILIFTRNIKGSKAIRGISRQQIGNK